MKRLIIVMTTVTILFMSCSKGNIYEYEEPIDSPFVGTWTDRIGNIRLVFTDRRITFYFRPPAVAWSGTYTFNETYITVTLEYRDLESATMPDIIQIPYNFLEDGILRLDDWLPLFLHRVNEN